MVQDEDSEDKQAWEDNWDDDKVDDDFSVQLRFVIFLSSFMSVNACLSF